MSIITKKCYRCKQRKTIDQFGKYKRSKDGLRWCCKVCQRERDRNFYRIHSKERIERLRWYYASRPDVKAAKNHRRRTRKVGNGGSFTAIEWHELCKKYDNRCLACGRDDVTLTVDHVVPLVHGGSNDISNIQPLCFPCNAHKHTAIIDYR